MIACPNKSSEDWKKLVKKHKGDEDLALAQWGRETNILTVQRSNIGALKSGKKTISLRGVGEHTYEPNDILKVKVKSNDTGVRVKVESITTVEDFTKLPLNRKDDFARAIGDYKDFEDFKKSDDYANEMSPLSFRFPGIYNFINGKVSNDIVKYVTVEELAKGETQSNNDMITLVNDIKRFLDKKLGILKNRKIQNQSSREKEITRILDNIKALDEVQAISTFVEEAYEQIKTAESQFDKLLKNTDGLTNSELVDKLSSFNEFANGYSILDEISRSDIEEYFNNPVKGLKEESSFTMQDKLNYALMARDKIRQRYLKQGIPLLADYLLGYKSNTLDESLQKQIDQLNEKIQKINNGSYTKEAKARRIAEVEADIEKRQNFTLDKRSLIKQLELASKDENALDYLFSPLISSHDSVLALFAKAVKSQLENARLEDVKNAELFSKEHEAFSKTNTKNKDNVAEFNSDLYEVVDFFVGRDSEGKATFVKKKAFVQKYDNSGFQKAKEKFFESIGPKPLTGKKAINAWNKKVGIWFKANTQPKDQAEIDRLVIAKKKELTDGIITQLEYNEWESNNIGSDWDDNVVYKRELSEPSDRWINPKWSKLYAEDGVPANAAGKYHMFLLDKYLADQQDLPENFQLGHILPSIPKDDIERALTNGVKNLVSTKLKESAFRQAYDTEYGLAGLTETDAKFLPVYYTNSIDVSDVSSDVLASVMQFSSMVNKYKALNNINGEISLMKAVMGERETIETNSKGEKIMDAFAAKMGYNEFIRKNGESFSQKHVNDFIDMVIYGEMQKKEEIFGMDAGKLTNTITGFSAVTTLAVDGLKATANNIQGNIQLQIEANSRQYFDRTNLKNGKVFYGRSLPAFFKDFGKIAPDSLGSKLVDEFDAIQGEFTDNYGRNVSGSTARKLFRMNTLFFNQYAAEHEIQVTTLFAHLDRAKVIDKATGKEVTLLEAYQTYGVNGIYENTNFTKKQRDDLQNRVHALNKRMHGVYNSFDKGTAQRYSLGRLILMYRKYLIPSYKRRFKSLGADQELGDVTEGYYRTFWNTFVRDLRDMQFNIANNWSNYTDFEKAQIKRTTAEASFILALSALVIVLKNIGDDDEELKKNYMYNFLLYQATRQRSETSAYISPLDAYRIVKSPSAMTSTLDRTIKFTNQLLFTWDPDKLVYQRKTGIWDKGDNKSWAYFLKLSGFSSYNFHPEEAVKSFEGTLNK